MNLRISVLRIATYTNMSISNFSEMDRQKTLVLPFGDDTDLVTTKRNVFGPQLIFAACRLAGCYHFNDKGKCTATQLMYSLIFNLLLVASYAYTLEDRVKQGIERSQNKTLIETSIGFVIVGGNVIFSVAASIVLYLYKNRFPQVMKNVGDFKFHAMNKVIAALLLTIYATMVALAPPNEKHWVQIPYDFVVFQHLLYISQYVALTNRWNR